MNERPLLKVYFFNTVSMTNRNILTSHSILMAAGFLSMIISTSKIKSASNYY